MDPQLTSFVVSEEETGHINESLSQLLAETNASYIMLIERSGQLISSQSNSSEEGKRVLGALLAGSFASSREIARVLNENDFTTLIQQGKYESIFAESIINTWILVVIYHKPTTLGMVQIYSKRTIKELAVVLERVKVESRSTRVSIFSNLMRTSEVADTVDLLFKDLAS
ncbi:MAG: roadblock/LC7 domain-containing protein [Chloroflexota bacterium]|nr:roadblock/LC7 domain-containing protein [Chloroflexota bacterium]